MNLKARLEGMRSDEQAVLKWALYLTPVTKPGTFAPSNRWIISVNRASGDIVFDRNGLYIRSNLATAAADASFLDENERMVAKIFHALLQRYPENEHTAVSEEIEISDEKICRYLLDPVLTAAFETFKLPDTRL